MFRVTSRVFNFFKGYTPFIFIESNGYNFIRCSNLI